MWKVCLKTISKMSVTFIFSIDLFVKYQSKFRFKGEYPNFGKQEGSSFLTTSEEWRHDLMSFPNFDPIFQHSIPAKPRCRRVIEKYCSNLFGSGLSGSGYGNTVFACHIFNQKYESYYTELWKIRIRTLFCWHSLLSYNYLLLCIKEYFPHLWHRICSTE